MTSGDLYVALIHYPVVDKHGRIITSSVTNLDLSDIARSCRTFEVRNYFVVHPSPDEQALNRRIIKHWDTAFGLASHPTRAEAFERLSLVSNFDEVLSQVQAQSQAAPVLLGTSAKKTGDRIWSIEAAKAKLETAPIVLCFGTAYGLAPTWNDRFDGFLGPICGPTPYNHLSVRSAVAIYLDRLRSC